MVIGYHCGISNDFSTGLGREAQQHHRGKPEFFLDGGCGGFVVGDSKLNHDFSLTWPMANLLNFWGFHI